MTPEDPHRATDASNAVHEGRPVDAELARGAKPGRRILWLLILSAGAAAILLLGMFMLSNNGFADQNANIGQQAEDARAFDGDSAMAPAADAPTDTTGDAVPVPTGEAPNVNAPTDTPQG